MGVDSYQNFSDFGLPLLICNLFGIINCSILSGFCSLNVPKIKINWITPMPNSKSFQLDLPEEDRKQIKQIKCRS